MGYSFFTARPFLASRHRLLASGLCLGLLGTLGVTVRSHLFLSPALAEIQTASTKNIAAEDLVGEWQGELTPGQDITWIFTPDGKLYMTATPPPNEPQRALEMRYQVDNNTKPMSLNIDLMQGATVMTIFDVTSEGQIRVQVAGTSPGQPRPTTFNNPTVFEKVSTSTTLPPNTEIDEFESRSQ
ncbi:MULTISPECIES: hypothetical protein [unclassified Coleofasciculus]|uniref:hypothetical protein n=1 Tax=unclassified Coleofasciculus TaxID=2692782 RepID=UPI001880DED4|nr:MULTISPECIES: hypothetical protein [unclassified Coleofasciculus]MBE9129803.1 hypothetical protein [Coleofasciculus sp. LEGE 07081]MBE9149188.1 hypothetical protein [Coleofasciculus sp. LEGE 07092]